MDVLILPEWNVNKTHTDMIYIFCRVLILPEWNVNTPYDLG